MSQGWGLGWEVIKNRGLCVAVVVFVIRGALCVVMMVKCSQWITFLCFMPCVGTRNDADINVSVL